MNKEPINDGGPAYPVPEVQLNEAGCFPVASPGMTLRDYFAGQALAGILANPQCSVTAASGNPLHAAVCRAGMVADAMLSEREKGGDNG